METTNYIVSMSPHIRGGNTIERMMATFILGLLPACLVGIYLFGMRALSVIVLSVASAVIVESVIEKLTNQRLTYRDLHAVLTGFLLALILPPSVPWWIPVIGAGVAIILGKMVFGGLGTYPFNPPLVAWVVVKLSWAERMSLFF